MKTKADDAQPARNLYVSPLFIRRRAYAEAAAAPWFVLSAAYGIVDPEAVIEPYDLTVSMMAPDQRDVWGRRVVSDLRDRFGELEGKVFEVHAGEAYRRAIEGPLHAAGATIVAPLAGLQIGQQLNWYDKARTRQQATQPAPPAAPATPAHGMDLDIEQVRRLGPFSHDWPDSTQRFEGGWEYLAAAGDQRFRIRHATGYAETYGQRRLHSVTFVRGEPVVEGVAADDYLDTYALISLLRVPGSQRHVRDRGSVPPGYAEFELVFHDEEIRAHYSPQSLAVKIREDDLRAWAAHALLRLSQSQRQRRTVISSVQAAQHLVDHGEPLDAERRAAVVASLLRFGEMLDERYAEGFELAHEPEADALLANDPFAFLIAVIADQSVVAERAWRLPLELQRRLGHLDLERIAADPAAVQAAVAAEPALHRYVDKVPRWIVTAASRVIDQYGGDASRIWSDEPTAETLFRRLDDFPGIGQKKAAMAVELLERLLRVPITHLEGSDIAYDIHVRRVFLRTGLARYDNSRHMIEVAREAHPPRPGALDAPAWEIGRTWCHPTGTDCASCALADPCPRFIDRALGVSGA